MDKKNKIISPSKSSDSADSGYSSAGSTPEKARKVSESFASIQKGADSLCEIFQNEVIEKLQKTPKNWPLILENLSSFREESASWKSLDYSLSQKKNLRASCGLSILTIARTKAVLEPGMLETAFEIFNQSQSENLKESELFLLTKEEGQLNLLDCIIEQVIEKEKTLKISEQDFFIYEQFSEIFPSFIKEKDFSLQTRVFDEVVIKIREFKKKEVEFLNLVIEHENSDSGSKSATETKINQFLQRKENFDFFEEWISRKESSLITPIVERLNNEIFPIVTRELVKSNQLLKKHLLSVDRRDWNIYHWFINGLVQKSRIGLSVQKTDFEMLKEIDQILKNNFTAERQQLLEGSREKPFEMLSQVHEIESSEYLEGILEILK